MCEAFEVAWQRGEKPRIEDYLGAAAELERSKLLEELFKLELDLRGKAGDTPSLLNFLQRFPEQAALIRGIFAQTAGQLGRQPRLRPPASTSSGANGRWWVATDFYPGEFIEERWQVRQVLRGGRGVVYVVRDEETAETLAAKTYRDDVLHADTDVAERFEREALAWIRMGSHPNVVKARGGDGDELDRAAVCWNSASPSARTSGSGRKQLLSMPKACNSWSQARDARRT